MLFLDLSLLNSKTNKLLKCSFDEIDSIIGKNKT